MEFSVFFNKLKIEDFYSENAENFLLKFKASCKDENDFIQLYELKDILSVENIFYMLHKAYLGCEYQKLNALFDEIERLSNVLEEKSISCYSYSYFFYVYITYIYNYDKYQAKNKKGMDILEIPEKMEWNNPKEFDYSKLGLTTFGVNLENKNGLTKAYPDYKKFIIEGNKLVSYTGTKSYIMIPDTISVIGKDAFSNNKKIKMVIIPDTVIKLEDGAFSNCVGLNLVHLSKKIKYIPNNCFYKCKNLKYVIGDNITTIGDSAFDLCVQLKDINLDNLIITGNKSFYGCVSLANYDFINNLKEIGDYAFTNSKIKSLILNDIKYLGKNAFAGSTLLTELIINNDINCLGETPFYGCYNIKTIDVKSNISFRLFDLFAIDEEKFNNYSYSFNNIKLYALNPYVCYNMTTIKSVVINKSDIIPEGSFYNCYQLENIEFMDNNIEAIEDYAFINCSSLKNLNINYNGNKIGNSAFYKCSAIEDFSFLNNVTHFGDKSLAYTNLTKFDFSNKSFKHIGKFAFANSYYDNNLNINLDGTEFYAGIFHGITNINCLRITNCSYDKQYLYALFERTKEEFIDKVSINSLITDFDAEANLFAGFNSNHIECKINNGFVPNNLFFNCNKLNSVNLIGDVDTFGDSCFKNCVNLENIKYKPKNEIVISSNAFKDCKKFIFKDFNNVKEIGDYAFYGSGITDLKLPNNINYIGKYAFGNLYLKPTVELPFVGNDIDSNKPFGIIFSKDLVSNSNPQVVKTDTYYIPKNIKNVKITGNRISDIAFYNCYFIEEIELPNIISLNQPIFSNCTSLKKISLGSGLSDFNAISLNGLENLENVIINNNSNFIVDNNSILSYDKRIAYHISNDLINDDIKIFKSNSVLNYTNDELILNDIDEIDNFAFDLISVSSISLNNCEIIKRNAFMSSDNLRNINIKSDSYNSYEEIFNIEDNDILLESLTLDNIKVDSIKSLFNQIDNLNVKKLTLLNCELNNDTFNNLQIEELHIINCIGIAKLNQKISKLSVDNSDEISKLFSGKYKFDNVIVNKNIIKSYEFNGLNCNSLILNGVGEIEENAFNNLNTSKLIIDGALNIHFGAFSYNKINTIIINNSLYICEDNCIYKNDELIYYRPNNKYAKIPASIKKVYKNTIDLINAKSLELPSDIYYEDHSIFNSSQIEKLICGNSNLSMISNLFDNTDSIKEIIYTSDIIKRKYLSVLPNVEGITLNPTIKTIDDFAFSNCNKLKSIENFDKAEIYGDFVLNECKSINNIVFNSNAKYIGYYVIDGCSSIKNISIPFLEYDKDSNIVITDILGDIPPKLSINITKGDILDNMFIDIKNDIHINYSPNYIGNNAFMNVEELTIDLKNTNIIGHGAFKNSCLYPNITLNNCKSIGDDAFRGVKNIKEIYINSNIESIGNNAFIDFGLEKLEINNSKKYKVINNCLFENDDLIFYVPNSNQNNLTISNVNRIRRNAFNNCINLKSIKFDNCKNIDSYSFNSCPLLNEINLGSNEININKLPFVNCDNIERLTVYSINQGNISKLSEYFGTDNTSNLKYLNITSNKIKKNEIDVANNLEEIILNNVTEIPDGYFSKCNNLTKFNIPNNCRIIGNNAFDGCKYINNLDLRNIRLEIIGDCAFKNTGIEDIYFGKSIKRIGKSILENAPIKSITFENDIFDFDSNYYGIGQSLRHISFNKVNFKQNAFSDKIKLEDIYVNNYTGNTIPKFCFSNCYKLEKIKIPANYKKIETYAFANCLNLNSFRVFDDIYVEADAFKGCNNISYFEFNGKCDLFSLKYFGFEENLILDKIIIKSSVLDEAAFKNYSSIVEIEIKNPIDFIPNECFSNCKNLKSLIINGVKTIGDNAFLNCYKLEYFDFSNCITIGNGSFKDCHKLHTIENNIVKTIGDNAFLNCNKLDYFDFSNCVTIGNDAFKNCNSLTKIELPSTVTSIKNAFSGCNNIKEIVFNNELEDFKLSDYGFEKSNPYNITFNKVNFKDSAFEDYISIEKIKFLSPIKSVPNRCFTGCLKLTFDDDFIKGLTSIGDCAFAGCESITNIELNADKIEFYAFSGCRNLENVKLGANVKDLPEGVFSYCNKLHNINLDNVLNIKNLAFIDCNGLNEFNLIKCISIEEDAFKNCNSLTKIGISSSLKNTNNCFRYISKLQEIVFNNELKNFKLSNYGFKTNVQIDNIIFDSVSLSDSAFEDYSKIKKIKFLSPIKSVPNKCFTGCLNLIFDDDFIKGLTSIGYCAFSECGSITNIELNADKIEFYAFSGCNNIKEIIFNNELKDFKLSDYGFEKSNPYNITFNKVNFKDSAFEDYISIEKIKFLSPIKSVPNRCFTGCLKLTFDDDFIKGLTSIGDCAFAGCESITNIELNADKIEFYAFSGCRNLENVKLGANVMDLPEGVFSYCNKLHNINLNNVLNIKNLAFLDCNSLNEFNLIKCISIENDAFKNCNSLTKIGISSSLKNTNNCFRYISKLQEIVFNNELKNFKLSNYGFKTNVQIDNIIFDSVSLSDSAFEDYSKINKVTFKNIITQVPKYAFSGTSMTFDSDFFTNLEKIGEYAFSGCAFIYNISLPNVQIIDAFAFEGCIGLEKVKLGEKLIAINKGLFANCTNLEDIELGHNVATIDDNAFMNTRIKSIDLYKSINYVGSMIFKDNKNSVKVIVPSKNVITSLWAKDWNLGLYKKHKLFRFMNPKVEIKERK